MVAKETPSYKGFISVSQSPYNPNAPYQYAQGFRPKRLSPRLLLEQVWSPIIFKDGKRQAKNFLSTSYLGLDVDNKSSDGRPLNKNHPDHYSIENALRDYCDMKMILGTTKSHSEACHRFRLVIPFEREIVCLEDYKESLLGFVKSRPEFDQACTGGAQFFFPMKKILHVSFEGYLQEVIKARPAYRKPPLRDHELAERREKKLLPAHVHRFVYEGKLFGEGRAQACFVAACEMFTSGFQKNEVFALLENSPFNREGFLMHELSHAVESAAKKIF